MHNRYDDAGTRIAKKGNTGETIYVNQNYVVKNNTTESTHIFAGQTRIATKMRQTTSNSAVTDMGVYYYHPDHLGSSSTVTDKKGNFYEHNEFFPYGEVWISESASTSVTSLLPFKFTSKELDSETGLYYYGARYMDPRLGRFVSVDPPIVRGEYFPTGNRDKDSNLPGMGGIFNPVNLNMYQLAFNDPVHWVDPDGNSPDEKFNLIEQKAMELYQKGSPVKDLSISDCSTPRKDGGSMNSDFGWRINPTSEGSLIQFHNGIDVKAKEGTPILAVFEGKIDLKHSDGAGWVMSLTNSDGVCAQYMHLSDMTVNYFKSLSDKNVKKGDVIGYTGNTGTWTTGAHLHFQVFTPKTNSNFPNHKSGRTVDNIFWYDPKQFLKDNNSR